MHVEALSSYLQDIHIKKKKIKDQNLTCKKLGWICSDSAVP